MTAEFERFQRDVDATSAPDYETFRAAGPDMPVAERDEFLASHPGLRRYDEAFDRLLANVAATTVAGRPAVWFLYNMGLVVKTPRATFGIDIAHRQDVRLEPLLDVALVTHNHDDHVGAALLRIMNRHGKTVVSNFIANYGPLRNGNGIGGYTRKEKTFAIADATIRTALSDHNSYLEGFTTTFELTVGDWTLYHTGDSYNLAQLAPTHTPDLWIVHPRCGLHVADAVRKFHPRRVVIGHLCEMGHPPTQGRWTLQDGLDEAAKAEGAGAETIVPLWGTRLQ